MSKFRGDGIYKLFPFAHSTLGGSIVTGERGVLVTCNSYCLKIEYFCISVCREQWVECEKT